MAKCTARFFKCRVRNAHHSKATCGLLRPAPWVTFVSAKVTKTTPPGWRENPTALLAGIGARLNSPGANYAPRAQTRGSLLPIPAAMLGRAIRGTSNTFSCRGYRDGMDALTGNETEGHSCSVIGSHPACPLGFLDLLG